MGLVYAIEDVVATNKEVCIFEEPCVVLDKNSRWIRFVS
jgi:hypothetical protein